MKGSEGSEGSKDQSGQIYNVSDNMGYVSLLGIYEYVVHCRMSDQRLQVMNDSRQISSIGRERISTQ